MYQDAPASLTATDRRALEALGIAPGSLAAVEPITQSLAGSRVLRLMLGDGTRRVLKVLAPRAGWLGAASDDARLREAQLWRLEVLARLPATITTAVERWALWRDPEAPEGGALLMRDERAHLFTTPLRPPVRQLPLLLDRLARMHATYWNDGTLRTPELGLVRPDRALLLVAPRSIAARLATGDVNAYLPVAAAGWETFRRLVAPGIWRELVGVFARPEPYARAISALPFTLVHGDVWGPNLGWLPPAPTAPHLGRRLLLLDWALAAAAPATYDPLWLCGTWHGLNPRSVLALYHARLRRHLAARGISLDGDTWLALAGVGYLRTVLTCGEALARTADTAPPGAARHIAIQRLNWWAATAARAAQRLVSTTPVTGSPSPVGEGVGGEVRG